MMASFPIIPMGVSPLTGCVALLIVLALYIIRQKLLPKPIPGIPYNKSAANSVLGDALSFVRHTAATGEPMDWFRQQAEAHRTPLLQLFPRPFKPPFVLLSDFGEVQAMMLSRSTTFDRSSIFRDILGGAGEHHHILKKTGKDWRDQRRLLADLMTPAFLHTVAAPHIYSAVHNIIELWEAKSRIGEGRPFAIDLDVDYLALDAVLAFTYGDAYSNRALVDQLNALNALTDSQIRKLRLKGRTNSRNGGNEIPAKFKPAPIHEDMTAILTMVHMAETLQSSVSPPFTWWWLSKTPKIRNAWSRRDGLVSSQLTKAVERLEQNGDDDTWLRNAVDLVVSRIKRFAIKEGRKPDYINPMTLEEVRRLTRANQKSPRAVLCFFYWTVLMIMIFHRSLGSLWPVKRAVLAH